MDFAFFVANFGYSRTDYDALTRKEKMFIYKAWENKLVADSTHLYNAVFTAVYNGTRQKRKRALKLWRKNKVKKANAETVSENLEIVREVEANEGKSWIDKIYQANGLKKPGKAVKNG